MTNRTLIVYFLLVFASCQKQAEAPAEKKIVIPKIELWADNKDLVWKQDILFYKDKPYSGYVSENYPNGQKASQNIFFDGKYEGIQQKWFDNGSKMEVRYYTDNRKNGKNEGWYPNGQKRYEYFIENDIPVKTHREWYVSGQLYSVANFDKQGQPDGVQQMWFANGQIKSNFIIKDGRRFGFLGAKGCMGENEQKLTGLKSQK